MVAEDKNMNKSLSQLVANLFAKSKGGEELSSRIQRLRDEIKKVTESEDEIFGKFRGLLESFQEVIPEEKQRYHAAIKALSTTSKLSRQEIIKAVNSQLEELKILEKGLMPALPDWRDEMKAMKAKSKQMRDEISKLREKIVRLESEEKEILKDMATREKEMEHVEKAIRELFADIGAEITHIKYKVEEFTAERAAVQPIPHKDSVKSDMPSEKKGGGEQKSEIRGSSAQQDKEWQKKCPMCGGRMDYYSTERKWVCYSCAHEDSSTDDVQGEREENDEHTDEYQESTTEASPSYNEPPTKTKTCPACRKKMYWYPMEKAWRCPSCQYERRI